MKKLYLCHTECSDKPYYVIDETFDNAETKLINHLNEEAIGFEHKRRVIEIKVIAVEYKVLSFAQGSNILVI
jgi:hypothetical protein